MFLYRIVFVGARSPVRGYRTLAFPFAPSPFYRTSLHQTQRRPYNYEPRDSRDPPPRVFKGVPVSSREVPPSSSFDNRGGTGSRFGFGGFTPPPSPSWLGRTLRSASMQMVMAVAAGGALLFYFSHLEVVPVSGRRRFNCFGEETMRMLGEIQYEQLMEDAKAQGQRFLPEYDPRTIIVRQVLRRLIPISGMATATEGGDAASQGSWTLCVIDDAKTVNAFVLPGGKVFVYSGIFNVARNEDALAAVLGHEIAHNLANHHGERASSAVGSTMLLASAFLLTGGLAYFVLRPVIDLVFNSPMSRRQESEADFIGLMLMAEACFDPAEAAAFWQRMDQAQKFQPPEFISTHPSNQHRMEKILEWMPAAMEKRQQSACDGTRDFAEKFKRALRSGFLIGM